MDIVIFRNQKAVLSALGMADLTEDVILLNII